jgi:hypothetical protein
MWWDVQVRGALNLGFHKDRYKVAKHQTFFATERKFTLLDVILLLLLRVNNVI